MIGLPNFDSVDGLERGEEPPPEPVNASDTIKVIEVGRIDGQQQPERRPRI